MFNINSTLSRRNFLAGAAALGSTATLAGCSSGGSDGGSADEDGAFKIGVIGPLTGAAATYGVSVEKGAKLAVKDFSTKELPLASKAEDDQADGEKAVNAFNTLLDWGMQALVGPTTTGASVAVAAECGNDPKTFMITPSASSEDVTDGKDCVFQVCFTDPNQGVNAAKFLAQKYADEKFVLFYNSGDAYSSGIADSFKAQAAESKLEIVDEETFKDDSATSFTNQLTKAKQAGATMIFAPIYYTPASVLLKNAKDMGYDVKMMGCDGMDGILGVEGFDTSLAEGLLLMTNDGAFAQAVTHPSGGISKLYRVTVQPRADESQILKLSSGVVLDDGTKTMPCAINVVTDEPGRTVMEMTLKEGKNREIRRMCEAVGLEVVRLKRNAEGVVKLGMLKPGTYRELTKAEVNGLRAAAAKGRAQTRSASLQSKAAARRPKGPVGSGNAPAKRRK